MMNISVVYAVSPEVSLYSLIICSISDEPLWKVFVLGPPRSPYTVEVVGD